MDKEFKNLPLLKNVPARKLKKPACWSDDVGFPIVLGNNEDYTFSSVYKELGRYHNAELNDLYENINIKQGAIALFGYPFLKALKQVFKKPEEKSVLMLDVFQSAGRISNFSLDIAKYYFDIFKNDRSIKDNNDVRVVCNMIKSIEDVLLINQKPKKIVGDTYWEKIQTIPKQIDVGNERYLFRMISYHLGEDNT